MTEVAARKKPTTRKTAATKPAKAEAAPDQTATEAADSQNDEIVVDAVDTRPAETGAPGPDKSADAADADAEDGIDDAIGSDTDDAPAMDPAPDFEHTAENPFPSPAPIAAGAPRSGGFGGTVFGGLVAALIGAFAAYLVLPQLGFGAKDQSAELAALQTRLEDQSGRIAELGLRVEAAEAEPDLSVFENGLSDVEAQIAAVADRVAALEERPVSSESGAAADSTDVEELRSALAAQQAQVEALMANATQAEANARASATATLRRAALTRIRTALDSGAGFDAALADLEATGQTVPEVLTRVAVEGVPTLAALQGSFPDRARAALAAARAAGPEASAGSGMLGFLSNQLGVRSLEPREGGDPDAILSRAEAALRDGRLTDAMAEIETLPEVARTELSGWAGQATKRMTAVNAAETLEADLE